MDAQAEETAAMRVGFADLPLTRAALDFARDRHAGQRREADDQPFVLHPLEVATLLRDAGYADHVVAAGALHDVLEDTDADKREHRLRKHGYLRLSEVSQRRAAAPRGAAPAPRHPSA